MKIQLAAGDGRSSTIKLYYHRMKIQPAVGNGLSSTKVVLPDPVGQGRHSEAKSVENDRGRPNQKTQQAQTSNFDARSYSLLVDSRPS